MMKFGTTETKPRRSRCFRALSAGVTLAVFLSASVAPMATVQAAAAGAEETVALTTRYADPLIPGTAEDRSSAAPAEEILIDRTQLIRTERNGVTVFTYATAEALMEEAKAYFQRAFSVNVTVDGAVQKVMLTGGTVADALAKAGILTGTDDIVLPVPETPLARGMNIRVIRVRYQTRMERQMIPFETQTIENAALPAGETHEITAGQEGQRIIFYVDKYVDGVLTETAMDHDVVTHPAVDRVEEVGTARSGQLESYRNSDTAISALALPAKVKLDENGIPVDYQTCIAGIASAYTGDPETSTGRTPMPGHIAVDPAEIPYGTELYIVSADGSYVYGYAIAADTGGFIYSTDRDVDLYMDNEQMCDDWGVRDVNIYVL